MFVFWTSVLTRRPPQPAVSGEFTRDHIDVTVDPSAALTAPVVEIATLTLKDGASAEKLLSAGGDFTKTLDSAPGSHAPAIWGQSVENKNKFFLVVGWDSLEVILSLRTVNFVRDTNIL